MPSGRSLRGRRSPSSNAPEPNRPAGNGAAPRFPLRATRLLLSPPPRTAVVVAIGRACLERAFEEHLAVAARTRAAHPEPFARLVDIPARPLRQGGRILFFGPGGKHGR